jgi:hypothetical protein
LSKAWEKAFQLWAKGKIPKLRFERIQTVQQQKQQVIAKLLRGISKYSQLLKQKKTKGMNLLLSKPSTDVEMDKNPNNAELLCHSSYDSHRLDSFIQ